MYIDDGVFFLHFHLLFVLFLWWWHHNFIRWEPFAYHRTICIHFFSFTGRRKGSFSSLLSTEILDAWSTRLLLLTLDKDYIYIYIYIYLYIQATDTLRIVHTIIVNVYSSSSSSSILSHTACAQFVVSKDFILLFFYTFFLHQSHLVFKAKKTTTKTFFFLNTHIETLRGFLVCSVVSRS